MDVKSFELFSKEHAATEKFDYFMCSVAGALFAYIAQNYTPHRLDAWFYFPIPVALLSLTLSFTIGLWVISLSKKVTGINKEVLLRIEENQSLHDGLSQGWTSLHNPKTAQTITPADAQQLLKGNAVEAEALRSDAIRKISFGNFIGWLRNFLLAVAFLLILASKVLQPYFG